MSESLKETWIYSLQDEDLISYCNEFDIDLSGSHRQCRDRFARFLIAEHKPLRMLRLLELQRKHSQDTTESLSRTKQLEGEIDRRYQRFDESFEHFACELQKLMQELNYSESRQFAIILRNSQPVFQHFIKRTQSSKLHELMTLSGDLEEIRDCMMEETRPSHTFKQLRYDASHIYATIYVCEIRAIATIDTGASRSFVSEDYVAKLGKRCRYVPVNAEVTLADGSVRVLKFAVEGQVRMGNICWQFQFIIMPDAKEDVILGLDFCMHVGATFSFGGETIQLESGEKTVAVPESEVNAFESGVQRRTTKLPSFDQSSTNSAVKRTAIEESATKPSFSSKRRREDSGLLADKNNSFSTSYQTRQQAHPMPLFANSYSEISLSNQAQKVGNFNENQFPFNPMINFPVAQWSPSNNSDEGNFPNLQFSTESGCSGSGNNSLNYFLKDQGPNGRGWMEANAFSGNNFSNNQSENRPGRNGKEDYCENNLNNQVFNSLAWNKSTTFSANYPSNKQDQNLAAAKSSSANSNFAAPTPIQPLLKTTKAAQEKAPPPNDFSKYDEETTAKLNKILEQASKVKNVLNEFSMLLTIQGQLFKISIYPNRKVFITGVPKAVSGAEKYARTSATSSQIAKDKKSTDADHDPIAAINQPSPTNPPALINPIAPVTTDVPINLKEKDSHELRFGVKSEMSDEAQPQASAELNVALPNPKQTSLASTNLNATNKTASSTKPNNKPLTNPTAPDNPDAPNDFSMYDAETTAILRQLVVDWHKKCTPGRRHKFKREIRGQLFKGTVSRGKVVTIVPNLKVPAKLGKVGHKVPQLDDKPPIEPQCALVNNTYSPINNSQMPSTSLKVPQVIPCDTPTVDLDLSMYDEELATGLLEFALDGLAGEHLNERTSRIREIRGRKFEMIIPRNGKVILRPKVRDIENKT